MGKRVAVIGAGLAGLPVIRYLTESSKSSSSKSFSSFVHTEVVGFEREDFVGGNWVYTDKTGIDIDGLPVHSSMYRNVRSNVPKDLLSYFDFPYKNKLPSYTGHAEVLEYIESFTDHFKLRQFIKFNTLVTRVTPLTPDIRDTRWEVTYCNRYDQSNTTTEEFDYVVVCTGHTSVPYVPKFPGLETFKGQIMHSHEYRQPEIFRDKTVLCIGGGPSACDIPIDITGIAKQVILCRPENLRFKFQIPAGTLDKSVVKLVKESSVVFSNGDEEYCDVIVICTGYIYSLPFLSKECRIVIEDEGLRVTPLFKHVVNIELPSLLFVGIPDFCASFNVCDIEARFVAKVIKGEITLPDKAEMTKDTDSEMKQRLSQPGLRTWHLHKIGFTQREYWDDLLCLIGEPKLQKGYSELFEKAINSLITDSLTFRDVNHEVDGDTYRVL